MSCRRAEGASNRHLNLNGRDTSLIWTYSQVGRKCCFHSQSATLGVPRSHYNVPLRHRYTSYTWFIVHNDEARKRERGIERLGKRQVTMPHRPVKRPKLLEVQQRKYDSVLHSTNDGATWPFSTPEATWVVQARVRFPRLSISRSLSCSTVVD